MSELAFVVWAGLALALYFAITGWWSHRSGSRFKAIAEAESSRFTFTGPIRIGPTVTRLEDAYCWGYQAACEDHRVRPRAFEERQAKAEAGWQRDSPWFSGPVR